MKQFSTKLRFALTTALFALHILAVGQVQTDPDQYLDFGNPSVCSLFEYYKEMPNRLFLQKRPDVGKDYIDSLLDKLTHSNYEISWCPLEAYKDDFCRVVVGEGLTDSVINYLHNDDLILTARKIYVKLSSYDKYIAFLEQSGVEFSDYLDSILKRAEIWFLNTIFCSFSWQEISILPKDSICDVFGLTYDDIGGTFINFNVPKNADVFDMSHKLLGTGLIPNAIPDWITPFTDMEMDFGDLPGIPMNTSDHYFYYVSNNSKKYYYEIPNRLFIQKSSDATQEHILKLLNRLLINGYEANWFADDFLEVILDGALTDASWDEVLNDEEVIAARHIIISKDNYERFLYYPYLYNYENCLLNNNIECRFDGVCNEAQLDSITETLKLTIVYKDNYSVYFNAPKKSDIFEVLQTLFEIGCFTAVYPQIVIPCQPSTAVRSVSTTVQTTDYYDISGHKIDSPSGLTIVVEQNSDGTVRTEKKLFR